MHPECFTCSTLIPALLLTSVWFSPESWYPRSAGSYLAGQQTSNVNEKKTPRRKRISSHLLCPLTLVSQNLSLSLSSLLPPGGSSCPGVGHLPDLHATDLGPGPSWQGPVWSEEDLRAATLMPRDGQNKATPLPRRGVGTLSPLDAFWTSKETRVKERLFPLGDAPDQSLSSPGAEGTYPAAVIAIQGKGHLPINIE